VAAALTNDSERVRDGLRPFRPAGDLLALADLMEIGFSDTMDESGRAAIREMRALGRAGWVAEAINRLEGAFGGLPQGFVWIRDGRLIGNVSIMTAPYPREAEGTNSVAIIANVVVHPDYRRQGIARVLLNRALDLIHERGCVFTLLQVDERNPGAQRLYASFGFRALRAFSRWVRPARLSSPAPLAVMPAITLRTARDWGLEYDLAQIARPDAQGGMGWLRPTYPGAFRPSLVRGIGNLLMGRAVELWAVYAPNKQSILASARLTFAFGSPNRFDLLAVPQQSTAYFQEALLNYMLRRLDDRYRSLVTEHPEDDVFANNLFQKYGFERRRTEVTMRLDFSN